MQIITGSISPVIRVSGSISGASSLIGSLTIPERAGGETYRGSYEFTPSASEQTIEIRDRTAIADIIINPIPQNYGLITWDGSTITVS